MDNPVTPPTPVTLPTLTQPQTIKLPDSPQKSGLPLLLTILFLLALTATGLLAYQNWQLNQRLSTITAPPTLGEANPSEALAEGDTANWKTYINSSLRFQFRYPSSFTVDDATNNQRDNKSNIYIYSRPDTVESYLEKNDDQIDQTNKTDIVIGENIKTKKITISNGANTTIYVVIPYGSNSFVEGSSLIIRGMVDGDETMFDQILSTFQFTN